MTVNVYWSSCKIHVVILRFLWKLNFLRIFSEKNTQMCNFIKFRPLAAELFHEDGRIDGQTDIVAFRNFSNAVKSTVFKTKLAC